MKKQKKKYQSMSHAKYHIRYHVILTPKYRKKVFSDATLKQRLEELLYEAANHYGFKVLKLAIEKDHIHLLVSCKPTMCVSDIVRNIKRLTTYKLWKEYPDKLHTFYYGKKHKLWTNGYFVSTIGETSEDTINKYIENQG